MKLKPLKFKQNGVRAESQKQKERNLGFCFHFETQVHIKVSARTAHLCNWLKCRFPVLRHPTGYIKTTAGLKQSAVSPILPWGKEGTCPGSHQLSDTIAFNLMPVETSKENRFLLWTEFLMQALSSGIWFRYTFSLDAAEPNANTIPSSSLYTN